LQEAIKDPYSSLKHEATFVRRFNTRINSDSSFGLSILTYFICCTADLKRRIITVLIQHPPANQAAPYLPPRNLELRGLPEIAEVAR
jgi:hypothetical protein